MSLISTVYPSFGPDHVHPLMTTVYPSLIASFSWIMYHITKSNFSLKLFSRTWQWVRCTHMASEVTRSQPNGGLSGCCGTRDWLCMCADDKSATTVMLSCQYRIRSLRNVSRTVLNPCHEEWRRIWREQFGKTQYYECVPNKVVGECMSKGLFLNLLPRNRLIVKLFY